MSKICPTCGKEYDDNLLKCPDCPEEQVEEILEVIEPVEQIETTETIEIIEEPPVEVTAPVEQSAPVTTEAPVVEVEQEAVEETITTVENSQQVDSLPIEQAQTPEVIEEPQVEVTAPEEQPAPVITEPPVAVVAQAPVINEVEQPAEPLPQVEPTVQPAEEPKGPVLDMPTLDDIHPTNITDAILDKMEENNTPEPVLKADSSGLETVSLEEVSVIVDETSLEPTIENQELESVSISSPDATLEVKEEEFVIPEMPAPSVGEINPDLLGNKYDADEALNNQKIEAKKQQDAMEMEKIRQEAAMKSQTPMEKPDLLARIPEPESQDVEMSTPKKKGKPMRKVLNAIIVILGIAVAAAAVWYFFIQGKEDANKDKYMEPVEAYLNGYKDADASKMLSAFVPCVSKSEEITLMITNLITTRNQYKEFNIEFKETSAEVVNNADQQSLDEYLKTTCGTDAPKVTDYKQVYVEQKIKTEQDKDFVTKNPKFWNVMIDGSWYILMVE